MLRKLVTAIIGVSALVPGVVFGLGMGEVELDSFLNQPLDARIELVQTGDLSASEVIASLASAKEFSAAGVDRSFFLSQLKFEIEKENEKTFLRISSKRPVTEPYLNFLVEVQWPAGRLLREYTLLLDPPEFKDDLPLAIRAPERNSSAGQGAVAAPGQAVGVQLSQNEPDVGAAFQEIPAEESAKVPTEADDSSDSMASKPTAPQEPEPSVAVPVPGSTVQTYTVKRGDTLSKIVKETQANAQAPMEQALVAFQYLNPDAFIDDNLNLIKSGAVLQVPSDEQVRQISREEAIKEIAAQNRRWRAKLQANQRRQEEQLAARQLDGTGRDLAPDEAPAESDEGRLSLVTPGAEDSVEEGASGRGESSDSNGSGSLQDQLALQAEEVEKFSIANEGMVAELEELEALVEKTDKVLALKDDQIAALRAQLQALEEQEPPQGPMDAPDSELAGTETEAEQAMAQDQTPEALGEGESPDGTAEEETPVPESTQEDMQEFDEAIAEEPPQSMFSNPLYLGAAGGVVLAILGFLWLRSRRDEDEDDDEVFDFDEDVTGDADEDEGSVGSEEFSTEQLDKQLLEAEDDFDIDTVLSEADIYVAYGHFPKAIAMLEEGLKDSPDSVGLNMKLLEVHAEAKDPYAFEKVEKHVRSLTSDDDDLTKINGMRADLGLSAGEGPEAAPESFSEEETQFLGEETSVPEASAPEQDEDFLSLADIEAELDVGGTGLDDDAPDSDNFDEEATTDNRFNAEETAVNTDDELDLSGGEFDFNFEETSVPDEEMSLDADLESFSPDDALADIDEEIGSLDDDLAAVAPSLEESDDLAKNQESPGENTLEVDLDMDLDADEGFSLDEGIVEEAPAATSSNASLSAEDASLLDGVDEVGTKIDLATAYIEMGDSEGAKDILDEVLLEGNEDQQKLAKDLLAKVG